MAKKRKGERPDGLIQVALDIGYWPDGRRRRKYFYGHTRTEANEKREAYKQYLKGGSKYKQDITVAEWVEIYKTTYRTKVNERYLKKNDVPYNRLVNKIGEMRMSNVTEADLQRALNATSGMSFSTVDKYRQAMKRVFKRAKQNHIIADNPAEDLMLPPSTNGSHRALEPWEVQLILNHWNEPGLRSGLWVIIMLLCGLRRGEMMALDWSAVDLENRLLTVRQVAVIQSNQSEIENRAKTGAGIRVIPICEPLYAALSSVPAGKRKGFVCVSATGSQLSNSAVKAGLRSFMNGLELILNGQSAALSGRRMHLQRSKHAGWKSFSFRTHDLRHTFCTMLYTSGVDVKTASYYMGHADIRVTMKIYTHLSQEKKEISTNLMLDYLNKLGSPD